MSKVRVRGLVLWLRFIFKKNSKVDWHSGILLKQIVLDCGRLYKRQKAPTVRNSSGQHLFAKRVIKGLYIIYHLAGTR